MNITHNIGFEFEAGEEGLLAPLADTLASMYNVHKLHTLSEGIVRQVWGDNSRTVIQGNGSYEINSPYPGGGGMHNKQVRVWVTIYIPRDCSYARPADARPADDLSGLRVDAYTEPSAREDAYNDPR